MRKVLPAFFLAMAVARAQGDGAMSGTERTWLREHMEQTRMEEGLRKFADPQKALLALLETKRSTLG